MLGCALAVTGLVLCGVSDGRPRLPGILARDVAQPERGPADDLIALEDPGVSRAERDAAADRLLDRVAEDGVREALTRALVRSNGSSGPRMAVLRALARRASAPEELFQAAVAATYMARPDEQIEAMAALGSFRTRSAAQILVTFTRDDRPAPVREAAYAALIRLTGRVDLGTDSSAWWDWYFEAITLSPLEWEQSLVRSLAGRIDSIRRERQNLAQRLVESSRTIWLSAKPDDRSRLLASFLLDDVEDIRRLGFDLVRQEIATGNPPKDEVGAAAMTLLRHPRATIRAEAARLLNQLAPPDAGGAVLAALEREEDPRVADALMAAVRRWPVAEARAPVLFWLEEDPLTTAAAADACLAMLRAGVLDLEVDRPRILRALRSRRAEDLRGPGLVLTLELGEESDRERLVGLLHHPEAPVRLATAEVLGQSADFVDALLAAASRDPALYNTASRAVRDHRPTLAGLRAIAMVGGGTSSSQAQSMTLIAERIDTASLLAFAVDEVVPLVLRESALSVVQRRRIDGENADAVRERTLALIELAKLRLELRRSQAALAALDPLKDSPAMLEAGPLADTKAMALVMEGRAGEAMRLAASADAWLRAIELIIDEPLAPRMMRAFERQFRFAMTPAQWEKYVSLRARLGFERFDRLWLPPGEAVSTGG